MAPAALVAMADRRGLAGLALTDHDTLAGLDEALDAAQAFSQLTFVPGIEIAADSARGQVHILGLFIDPHCPELTALVEWLGRVRHERNVALIETLRGRGLDVSFEEWRQLAGGEGVMGRPHLAELLVRKGTVADWNEAFADYIGPGAPGYVEKDRARPADICRAIHAAGGLAMLAHPTHLGYTNRAEAETRIRGLVEAGLDGLEAYHSDHSDPEVRMLLDLAARRHLAVSGGSDFHGPASNEGRLGRPRVPVSVLEALLARRPANR